MPVGAGNAATDRLRLLSAPREIFDVAAFHAAIDQAVADGAGAEEIKTLAKQLLREAMDAGRAVIEAWLRAGGAELQLGPEAARSMAQLTDDVVCAVLDMIVRHVHRNSNPTAGERLSVLAVGGYGRFEMAPFSDVDLLFLTAYKKTAWSESVIESTLYILWDLRMKVGQSVRSVADCVRLGREDMTIRTALLERRLIWGDAALADELSEQMATLFAKTGPEFVEAKLAERDARHARQGGSRYLVEPNVKEGKGGLRDLQTLYWIAKYLYHVDGVEELIGLGVFEAEEVATFAAAERFLWTTRSLLHAEAGRATEQLTFDMQVEVAAALGFEDANGQRGVERFMQRYFRAAKDVGDLTRFFCTALETSQIKKRPGLRATLLRAIGASAAPAVGEGFALRDVRLDVDDDEVFDRDPGAMLRLFEEGLRTGALIHPNAHRLVARKLHLVDQALREDPVANKRFLKTFIDHGDPERALRRMNESGFLGAFIPDFHRVVAMMQFNMYHHYTVDEHTIAAIGQLARIEAGELGDSLPIATDILRGGVDRTVLYVALFLHDIGKGQVEDHSIVGARIAERLCPRLGLDEGQTEMVTWLVRHHLLMSDIAQKRDISDPRTVQAFAEVVRSQERLKLLLLLTVCDIRAVGPNVWNNWKAQLLRGLYRSTRSHLVGGHDDRTSADMVTAAKELLRSRLKTWAPEEVEPALSRHYAPYWRGLDHECHVIFARLGRNAKADKVYTKFVHDDDRGATKACLTMSDHPGIFTRIAGAFALAGASIVEARSFTSSDGMAAFAFWLQDADGAPFAEGRLDRLKKNIDRALRGEVVAREALKPKRRTRRREQPFKVPTRISFDNDASDIFTVIEVDTRDRTGLVYDLTRTLAALNINISSAVIATYGEQAVDSFYVKDIFGHKITESAKHRLIARRLREAISRAAEDAAAAG